jgi:hypothetical protein
MYCGNNRLHPELLDGTKRLGTRKECLDRGVRVGLSLPPERSYAGRYEPIDNTKIYCGNSSRLPDGYDRFGAIFECHRIGVGRGKNIKSKRVYGRRRRSKRKSRKRSRKRSKREKRSKRN